jgi:peptidoglycan/LPS O-acetylase OafA/YrhL
MPPRQPRYDSLDLWRGVACLVVVAYHAAVYTHSDAFEERLRAEGGTAAEWLLAAVGRFWFGVPVFFVISGYCIAASADAVRAKPGSVGRYFVRRVRRIYPPLWVATAIGIVLALVLQRWAWPGQTSADRVPLADPAGLTAANWIGNLTLIEEWRPALGGPAKDYFLGQIWTLCYEEQFYLVVGVLLAVCPHWFFPAVWAVTGLVVLNLADLSAVGLNRFQVRIPGLFSEGLWLSFAAGVAVYYRRNHADAAAGRIFEALLVLVALAAVRFDADPLGHHKSLAKWTWVACGFAVLICRLSPWDAALSTARWAAPLRFCGRMCYSLYLVHPLAAVPVAWLFWRAGLTSPAVTVFVALPLATLASIPLGYAFHRLVEQRFAGATSAPVRPIRSAESRPTPAAA